MNEMLSPETNNCGSRTLNTTNAITRMGQIMFSNPVISRLVLFFESESRTDCVLLLIALGQELICRMTLPHRYAASALSLLTTGIDSRKNG